MSDQVKISGTLMERQKALEKSQQSWKNSQQKANIVPQNKLSDRLAGLQKNATWQKKSSSDPLPVSSGKLSDRLAQCQENAKYKEKKMEVQSAGNLNKKLDLLNAAESNWKKKVEHKDHQSLSTSAKAQKSGNKFSKTPSRTTSLPVKSVIKPQTIKLSKNSEARSKSLSEDISDLEKLATRKGEDSVSLKVTRNQKIPKFDESILDEILSPSFKENVQPAKDAEDFSFIPQSPPPKITRLSKPRRKRPAREQNRNPLRSAPIGEDNYTEEKTNLSEKMSGKVFTNSALAGLAAKEDINAVKLKSKNDRLLADDSPYKHPMLIKLKGRKRAFPFVVPCSISSLTNDDSFILITQSTVFVFLSEFSNIVEKAKAKDFARFVCQTSDLGTKNPVYKLVSAKTNEFWKILGGKMEDIEEVKYDPDMADDDFEAECFSNSRVWEVIKAENEDSAMLKPVENQWGRSPSQKDLESEKIFVFEFGAEIYTWIGAKAQYRLRTKAKELVNYLIANYYGESDLESMIIGRVTEHRETSLFSEKFVDWIRPNQENVLLPIAERNKLNIQIIDYKPVTPDLDTETPDYPLTEGKFNVSGGDGEIVGDDGRIMKISTISYEKLTPMNGKLKTISKSTLTSEDVVLVIWKFSIAGTGKWFGKQMKSVRNQQDLPKGSQKEVLFLWGGTEASELLLGEAALLAQDLGLGVTHNLKPGMEPKAFLKAWSGRLTIEKSANSGDKLYTNCDSLTMEVTCDKESVRHGMNFFYRKEGGRRVQMGSGGPSWFSETPKEPVEKVEKLWSAENFKDRIVAIELPSRKIWKNYPYELSQLTSLSLLMTNIRIYIISDTPKTEGSHAQDFQKRVECVREIAKNISNGKTIKKIEKSTLPHRFKCLFPPV
ncbi:Oidioi.mRNA.OKI2018_I69.PAR.g9133.t1.cds [Oikopleura dioica]|uniref:Oidioi.mRNA.OKI2018_I69.PAR.g9133.t1.cds n=1 Tax=Oikopleura dioica TaxID=34765 RepID=A0ABN7RNI7_OIKDI|nr:Oidioi.mRNA.OKI2018_I69.PAR.g9133.t1.cds [Oikopleura dioica]